MYLFGLQMHIPADTCVEIHVKEIIINILKPSLF